MPTTELSTSVAASRLPARAEATNSRPVREVAASATAPRIATNETQPESTDAERSSDAEELDMAQTVNRLNDLIQTVRRELRFSVDDASGDTVITVIDSETEEVVRQIPPEEVLTLVAHLQEAHNSLMMDLKA